MTKHLLITALLIFTCSIIAPYCFSQTISSKSFGFIENKGQIIDQDNNVNAAVKFLLCRPGFNVQLRQSGFSYDTYANEVEPESSLTGVQPIINNSKTAIHQPQFSKRYYHRVDVELLNCNKNAELSASGTSTAYFNYFTGVKEGGIQNVRNYQKVVYKNIYPNIDLEFFTQGKAGAVETSSVGVEYQFVIHPGGNVNDIQLAYNGASDVLLENNTISVKVLAGLFTEKIPSSYLKASGQKVKVDYQTNGANIFSFHLSSDLAITSDLVIDPTPTPNLQWGTYYGGSGDENGEGIGVDARGNVYVTGSTQSVNNIATVGAYQTTLEGAAGQGDAFLAKFNPAGDLLLWGTYYGGGINYNNAQFGRTGYTYGGANANGIAVDAAGNSYITGSTTDSNGIATTGAYQTLKRTDGNATFVAKFTTNGALRWGTFYGQPYRAGQYNSDTQGQAIVLDADEAHVYITGTTADNSGIATPGAFSSTYSNGATVEAFAAKFDTSGANLLWGTYFADNSGNGRSFGVAITLDATGNVYITGNTGCTDLATNGTYKATLTGIGTNAFIAKLNPKLSGASQLVWCSLYGGNEEDYGNGIAVDANQNVYVSGTTGSDTGIASEGAYQDTAAVYPFWHGFIVKFNPSGSKRIWGTYFGGTLGNVQPYRIALDACRNIYVAGSTGANGMATFGAYQTSLSGSSDAFVSKLDSSGKSVLWCTYYGEAGFTTLNNFVFSNNNVYAVGSSTSTSGISTTGAYQSSFGGGTSTGDAFIAEFGNTGICTACSLNSVQINSPADSICSGNSIALSAFAPGSTNVEYTWSQGGQHTQTIQVSPSSPTKYIVTVQDTIAGCTMKDSTTIHVITGKVIPAVTISVPSTNICAGTALTFTAAPVNEGSSPVYRWRVNNQKAGTNSSQFSDNALSNNDVVSCLLTSSIVCASPDTALSNKISIIVTTVPDAGVIATSSDTVCAGTPKALTLTGSSGNIQWQYSSNPITYTNVQGANSGTYKPLISQNTYIRAYTFNGNCADTSAGIELFAIPAPNASFTDSVKGHAVSFNTSSSLDVTFYSWDFGDNTTSTDKNPVHTYDSSRVYYTCLTVYNHTNCSFTTCLNVSTLPTGINSILPANAWIIYPNPFSSQIYIDNSESQVKVESIKIIDVLGRVVFSQQTNNEIASRQKLDVSDLNEGVYYLVLRTREGDYEKTLIKQ